MQYKAKFTREQCQSIANDILAMCDAGNYIGAYRRCIQDVDCLPSNAIGWKTALLKLATWLQSCAIVGMSQAPVAYGVFSKGNGKLPFFAFSTLPGVTCPGAGACLEFCYSFRAWRFPYAFGRQLQNTVLMRCELGREIIERSFDSLPQNSIVRLYVDGDFSSVQDVEFWFDALRYRSDIKAYGYSKSWAELLQCTGEMPINYTLNLSGGSIHTEDTKDRMRALPIVRDVFDTAFIDETGLPRGAKRYESPEYHRRVRQAYFEQTGNRAFSCPGKCGSCRFSSGMHACGDKKFPVPIVIGVH